MHTASRVRFVLIAALGLAACGGSDKPAPQGPVESTGGDTGAGDGARVMAPGTSGLPGLDWGASADAVLALYPRGQAADGGIEYLGTFEKHQAILHFAIGADGLSRVDIEWTDGFLSMEDCGETWKTLRAELDGRLGASQGENLAAYWELATADVTLSCNPNDSGAGVLSQTYSPRHDE
jgi:hypothetical protein